MCVVVKDKRPRRVPRSFLLIALVHLWQQAACVGLCRKYILGFEEPGDPRRSRRLDDETIRRCFHANRNVAGSEVHARSAPIDPVMRELADVERNGAWRGWRYDSRCEASAFELRRPYEL